MQIADKLISRIELDCNHNNISNTTEGNLSDDKAK